MGVLNGINATGELHLKLRSYTLNSVILGQCPHVVAEEKNMLTLKHEMKIFLMRGYRLSPPYLTSRRPLSNDLYFDMNHKIT
jgi:hypothetical protein